MSELIGILKEEHCDIVDLLMRVKLLKVCSDDGQRVLMKAKDMLLEHLKKEDESLYPSLRDAAGHDKSLSEQLGELENDMAKVSQCALDFFEKYSADTAPDEGPEPTPSFCERVAKLLGRDSNSPEKEFSKDFDVLYDTLLERVRKEEATIYATYDRLAPK